MTSGSSVYDQSLHQVRFDWGLAGAQAIAPGVAIVVVVDVLSFTTAVSVALDAGAEVCPYRFRDDTARSYAAERNAVLAVDRSKAGEGDVSLSPVSLRRALVTGRVVVLPSPNGATICQHFVGYDAVVVAACLRNAAAVGAWVAEAAQGRPIAVIAAGEQWPDGGLRPAVEDLWGAGAILEALALTNLSPEAHAARAAFRGSFELVDPVAQLHATSGGRELRAMGFGGDVDIAAEVNTSVLVPALVGDRFRPV